MKFVIFIIIVIFVLLLGIIAFLVVSKNPKQTCPDCPKQTCPDCPKSTDINKFSIVNNNCVIDNINGKYTSQQCLDIVKQFKENYTHSLYKDWSGKDLKPSKTNNDWSYFIGTDPTNGVVRYGAHEELISFNSDDSIEIRMGSKPLTDFYGFRDSIRLQSINLFSHGVFILSVDHIPEGLTVWPAFWLLGIGSTWPCAGEIDILEGVNSINTETSYNQSTLHTNNSCDQSSVDGILGETKNCNAAASDKKTWSSCGCSSTELCATLGCGKIWGPNTFGYSFNRKTPQGGVFACELTKDGQVTMWFFEKNNLPFNVSDTNIDVRKWNNPVVKYNVCKDAFKNLQIIINTTLCGDWAGSKYDDGKNKGNDFCIGAVRDPNYTMTEAYWKINWLKVFLEP